MNRVQRTQQARVNSEMQTLFARFTMQIPDGKGGYTIRWANADAERRYRELEKSFPNKFTPDK